MCWGVEATTYVVAVVSLQMQQFFFRSTILLHKDLCVRSIQPNRTPNVRALIFMRDLNSDTPRARLL